MNRKWRGRRRKERTYRRKDVLSQSGWFIHLWCFSFFFLFCLFFQPLCAMSKWAVCCCPARLYDYSWPQPVKVSKLADLLFTRCHSVSTRRLNLKKNNQKNTCFSWGLNEFSFFFHPFISSLCHWSGTWRWKLHLRCPVQTFACHVEYQAHRQELGAVGRLLRNTLAEIMQLATQLCWRLPLQGRWIGPLLAHSLTHSLTHSRLLPLQCQHPCAFGWMMRTFVRQRLWMERRDHKVKLAVILPTPAVKANSRQLTLLP